MTPTPDPALHTCRIDESAGMDPAVNGPTTSLTPAELADAQPRTASQKPCSNPMCPLRYAHRGPCAPAGPEVTPAIERAGRAIWEHDNGHTTWPPRDPFEIGPAEDAARAGLTAALDVEEMAEGACRAIHSSRWDFASITEPCDECWATAAAWRKTILGGAA